MGDATVTGALASALNMKNTPNDEKTPARPIMKKAFLGAFISFFMLFKDIKSKYFLPMKMVQVALTDAGAVLVTTNLAIVCVAP